MSLEFVYFDIQALGLMPRLVLKAANIDFVDSRVDLAKWHTGESTPKKSETPLGQVPLLRVNGKEFCQSTAIVNYCAKLAKIDQLEPLEALKVDMFVETAKEVFDKMRLSSYPALQSVKAEEDPDWQKRGAAFFELFKKNADEKFALMEKCVSVLGVENEFVAGKETLADYYCVFWLMCAQDCGLDGDLEKSAPSVVNIAKNVMAKNKAVEAFANDKETKFWPWTLTK